MTRRSIGAAMRKSLSGKWLLSKSLLGSAVLAGMFFATAPAAQARTFYPCRRPLVYRSYPEFRHRIAVERAEIRRMEWREHNRSGYYR